MRFDNLACLGPMRWLASREKDRIHWGNLPAKDACPLRVPVQNRGRCGV